jgi:hypothetical protein
MKQGSSKKMEPEIAPKKAIHETAYETRLLADKLRAVEIGSIVKYADLSAIIGQNTQGDGRGYLNTARRIVLRDNQIWFGTIRGEGLKRFPDTEKVKTHDSYLSRVRRATRRQRVIMQSVDYNALPKTEQVKHNVALSQYGVINFLASDAAEKKLTSRVTEANAQLPVGKSLEIFK